MAKKNQEAVRWLRDAVRYQPKTSAYWLDLGIAYERLHDKTAAIGSYRKAADLGNVQAESYLAELYTTGDAGFPKDDAQALYWLRKAAAQGDDPAALNTIAWTYATSTNPAIRNPTAALEYARKAVELTKDHPNPAFLDTLAEAYYVNGRKEDAVKTEEQAIALVPLEDRAEYQPRLDKYKLR